MNQPKWPEYMLPELKVLSDDVDHRRGEVIEKAADMLHLTSDLKKEEISSGIPVYLNRGGWALTYLKQSGLIISPERGVFRISQLGKDLLKTNPVDISFSDLKKYEGFRAFRQRSKEAYDNDSTSEVDENDALSPDEMIERAEKQYKEIAREELLTKLRTMSDKRFEKVVVKLLLAMGYGDGNDPNCGFVVGKTGDGGIDGVIKQDKLGINKVYIQAKRYAENNHVSVHDVRDFGGALVGIEGNNAKAGVFITTSDFTKDGKEYAAKISGNTKVILINGEQLADYMYQYGLGVTPYKTIVLNKLDADFFDED